MVGMLGLQVTRMDAGQSYPDLRVCYANAATYPLTAPYRRPIGGGLYGRIPRSLSLIFTTLANTPNRDYDASSHTLTLGAGFARLRARLHLGSGGNGLTGLRDALRDYETARFDDGQGGQVAPFSRLDMDADRALSDCRIVFTDGFTHLLAHDPKPLPCDALTVLHGAILMDLLVLAAVYCPEDRRLVTTVDDLRSMLPATSKSSVTAKSLREYATRLNAAQSDWVFSYDRRMWCVQRRGLWVSGHGSARLH